MKQINENYFFTKLKKEPDKKVEDFLDNDEKVLWRGIPKKTCYILENTGPSTISTPFAVGWGLIDLFLLIMALTKLKSEILPEFRFIVIIFFIIHMTPTWIWLVGIIKLVLILKKQINLTEYVITDKRILIFHGNPKNINNSVMLEDISTVNHKQSFTDKLFHVADIYINSLTNKIVLFDIPNGIFISKKLQQLVKDNQKSQKTEGKIFYKYNVVCSHCGSYYSIKNSRCPSCGAPRENN